MASLDATPDTVDLAGYAGDTLTFTVTAPSALVDGKEWLAQVRSAKDAAVVDATFTVLPPTVADGPATLTLSAADTARLCEGAPVVRVSRRRGRTLPTPLLVQQYSGMWDVQISEPGGLDPVITLAAGLITVDLDVSRSDAP